MTRPSLRQAEILDFIRESLRKHGIAPTYREIAQRLRLKSVTPARNYVLALIKKGYLRRRLRSARGLTLVQPEGDDPLKLAAEIVVESPDGKVECSWLFGRSIIFAPDGAKIHIATPGFHHGSRRKMRQTPVPSRRSGWRKRP